MTRLLSILLVALVAAGGAYYWSQSQTEPGVSLGSLSAQEAEEVDTSMVEEMFLGDENAAVTVYEYASFTCPHCRSFHETTFKELKENYIDTGKIKFVMREVYFDRFGLWAGMVARCGGSERYFGIVDLIFEKQREWAVSNDPAATAENLRRIGATAGLSPKELDACLSDGDHARGLVAVYQQNAEADGINATPSFVIDGENYSNMSYADFAAILDEKLGS